MLVNIITEFCIITYWVKVARFWILATMIANCCNTKTCAIWACPYNIWVSKPINNILCSNFTNVLIPVNVLKVFVPFDGINFVTMLFKSFADTSKKKKKF